MRHRSTDSHVLYTPFFTLLLPHFSSVLLLPSFPFSSLLLFPSYLPSSAPLFFCPLTPILPPSSLPSYPHKEYRPAHLECDPGMDLVLMPFRTDSVEEFFARLEAARTLHRMICPGRVLRVVFVADYGDSSPEDRGAWYVKMRRRKGGKRM